MNSEQNNVAKSNMSMDGVHCKAHKNDEIRRFLLKAPQMAHLQSILASVFNLHHNFQIKYQNDEEELIAITEDGDLEVAMKKGGCLRLFVVGDEANVAVSVVRDEEMNLGKKVKRSDKEFLGGKGRKFCRREKGEKKRGGRRKRRSEKSKCESNEPLEVISTPQVENTSPVTSVQKDEILTVKVKTSCTKKQSN